MNEPTKEKIHKEEDEDKVLMIEHLKMLLKQDKEKRKSKELEQK
jgi:hypothetical protein